MQCAYGGDTRLNHSSLLFFLITAEIPCIRLRFKTKKPKGTDFISDINIFCYSSGKKLAKVYNEKLVSFHSSLSVYALLPHSPHVCSEK